jgi:hypothetical protein
LKQIRRHITYANVMSSFAVFLILGGATAFAAVKKVGPNEIKANSIKTGKIVKEAVTAGKIKKNAVTESRIADGAVTTNKIADNAVTTPKIANDAVTGDKVKESTLGTVPSAETLAPGGDAKNLVQGFATINAGATPDVLNSGGKAVTSVSVNRVSVGNYEVTFNGNFPGVSSINNVATNTSVWDTNNFDVASASNDQSSASSSKITIRVFVWSDNGDVATPPLVDSDFTVSFFTN